MELNTNTNLENDILIVDDSDDTLELLSALLTIAGYIVSTANNGTKALQIVKEKKFSLILLDIMLPDIDGYEVCKKLKEDESSKYIPIIFISALNDEPAKTKGFNVGAADFIIKPFYKDEVLARIKTQLDLSSKKEQLLNDINTLKNIEESLRYYQFAMDRMADAVYWVRADGKFEYLNDAASNMLGYTKDELLKMSIKDIVTHERALTWPEHWEELKKSGNLIIESFHISKSKENIPVEIRANYMFFGGKEYNCGFVRDITERKRAEEDLKESLSLLTATLESTADGILVVDKNGHIAGYNTKFVELFKVPESILLTKDDSKLLSYVMNLFVDPDGFLKKVKALYLNDDETSFDILEFKDGRTFERYSQAQKLDTKNIGRVWSFRDITKRLHAIEALKESDKSYLDLFNTVTEAIYILDKDGYFIDVNTGAERMYDYKREDIIGKTPAFLSAEGMNDLENINKLLEKTFTTGETQQFEFWGRRKDNKPFPKDVVANKGTFFGQNVLICTARDITERKLAESILVESELKFKLLNQIASEMLTLQTLDCIYKYIAETLNTRFPNTIILIVSVDEQNNDTCLETVAGINNSMLNKALSISGFNPVGKRFRLLPTHDKYFRSGNFIEFNGGLAEFAANEFPSIAGKAIEKLIGLHKIYTIGINKDDRLLAAIHFITFNKTVIDDSSFIESLVKQSGIIIQKKMVELKLKENETSLRELNATKDKFFSIIAHDLRSPFNAIMGFSDLLVENVQEKEYDNIEEYSQIIHTSSQRALNLLTNLMEWSYSQTGKMEFNPEYFEAISLVNDIIEMSNDSAQQKSISIIKEFPRSAPVFADKSMISTVLRNLISNAIKFTFTGGIVTINIEQKKAEVLITISDNGVGMRQDVIKKLFSIDQTYSTVGTNKEKGTGLGLILCKEFINKHNGKIWVESEPGHGSKFYFTIPKN